MNMLKAVQAAPDPFATTPNAPTPTAPPPAAPATTSSPFDVPPIVADPAGLSGQDWAIALVIMVLAGVVWFFVRGAVQSSLARNHVAPDAAIGVSWSLFAFLMALTATAVFGLIGNLWVLPFFLFPAAGLTVVLLVLTVIMTLSALRRRR